MDTLAVCSAVRESLLIICTAYTPKTTRFSSAAMTLSASDGFLKTLEVRRKMLDWVTAIIISLPWAALVGFLMYVVKNPEKVEKWSSLINRAFSFASLRIEKRSVAQDIQSDINSFVRKMNPKGKNSAIPYGVKIHWIGDTTREAFIRNGKVVVRMQKHNNQARNFLYATMEWVKKGLIPESRHLLDKRVLKALDFALISKVLTEKKRHDSKQLFIDEVYGTEAKTGSLVERYSKAFGRLDGMGLFMGVVLPEYSELGKNAGCTLSSGKVGLETLGFAEMLEKFSKRTHGEEIDSTYCAESIKCAIMLIARSEKYTERGLAPYLTYINKRCEEGARSLYLCGIGETNIQIVRKIRDAYEKSKKIRFVSETTEPIRGKTSIVIHLESQGQVSI